MIGFLFNLSPDRSNRKAHRDLYLRLALGGLRRNLTGNNSLPLLEEAIVTGGGLVDFFKKENKWANVRGAVQLAVRLALWKLQCTCASKTFSRRKRPRSSPHNWCEGDRGVDFLPPAPPLNVGGQHQMRERVSVIYKRRRDGIDELLRSFYEFEEDDDTKKYIRDLLAVQDILWHSLSTTRWLISRQPFPFWLPMQNTWPKSEGVRVVSTDHLTLDPIETCG